MRAGEKVLDSHTGGARNSILALGLIFILALAAYSNSFKAGFHFDDFHQIVKNQNIRHLENVPKFFARSDLASYQRNVRLYRPLTQASFAINYAISGDRVWSYHLFNFVLHFLNAFMVFLIVRRVLASAGKDGPSPPALLASLAFALHPVQTNAVTYISCRALLLATLFSLAAFYCFLQYRSGAGRAAILWGAASPALLFAALLSKEMAISMVFIIIAYDLLFTVPESGGWRKTASIMAYWAAPAFAAAVYLALKMNIQGYIGMAEPPYTALQYLLSEGRALLIYLRVLVMPINLNVDYELPAADGLNANVVLAAAMIVSALALMWRLRRKSPAAVFFGLWSLLALAPESTLVPITDIAVEYRLYLPSIGFIAAAVAMLSGAVREPRLRTASAAVVLALFSVLTFARNAVWATEYTLWDDAARKAPYSARTHANLGNALVGEGRYLEAIAELQKSLEINPFYEQSYNVFNNLGICFYKMDMLDEAAEQFERSTRVYPGYIEGYANLGAALFELGRYGEAVAALEKAVIIDPGYAPGHANLAQAYGKLGRTGDEIRELELAVECAPKDFTYNLRLAQRLTDAGLTERARGYAEAAAAFAADAEQRAQAEEIIRRPQ